jgi:catechol 2,3-dioxygenase-like lactoylglutathione lyase family enzyme
MDSPLIHDFTAYVHVEDVRRSIAFYQLLGFETGDTLERDGRLNWASLRCGDAWFMIARAEEPIDARKQAVLFYLHTTDVAGLRERLVAAGITVGEIRSTDYMREGEIRIEDPDGYTLLIGQVQVPSANNRADRPTQNT